jgi:hypothetical protein
MKFVLDQTLEHEGKFPGALQGPYHVCNSRCTVEDINTDNSGVWFEERHNIWARAQILLLYCCITSFLQLYNSAHRLNSFGCHSCVTKQQGSSPLHLRMRGRIPTGFTAKKNEAQRLRVFKNKVFRGMLGSNACCKQQERGENYSVKGLMVSNLNKTSYSSYSPAINQPHRKILRFHQITLG